MDTKQTHEEILQDIQLCDEILKMAENDNTANNNEGI